MGIGAELDPRPGGHFRLHVEGDNVAIGEYLEVDPPNRLLFTWGWDRHPTLPPGSTTVEISLVADGPGTILRLRHKGFPTEADRRRHSDGWDVYLGNLSQRLSS